MADTYTIKSVDERKGLVTVHFSVDNKTQTIGGAPVSNADALTAFLDDYATSYRAGLEIEGKVESQVEQPAPPADQPKVEELINVEREVPAPIVTEAEVVEDEPAKEEEANDQPVG